MAKQTVTRSNWLLVSCYSHGKLVFDQEKSPVIKKYIVDSE